MIVLVGFMGAGKTTVGGRPEAVSRDVLARLPGTPAAMGRRAGERTMNQTST